MPGFLVAYGLASVGLPEAFLDLGEEIETLHGLFHRRVFRKIADGVEDSLLDLGLGHPIHPVAGNSQNLHRGRPTEPCTDGSRWQTARDAVTP